MKLNKPMAAAKEWNNVYYIPYQVKSVFKFFVIKTFVNIIADEVSEDEDRAWVIEDKTKDKILKILRIKLKLLKILQ